MSSSPSVNMRAPSSPARDAPIESKVKAGRILAFCGGKGSEETECPAQVPRTKLARCRCLLLSCAGQASMLIQCGNRLYFLEYY